MTEWDATGGLGFIDQGVTEYQLPRLADCNEERRGDWAMSTQAPGWEDVCTALCHSECTASLPGSAEGLEASAHHGRYAFFKLCIA